MADSCCCIPETTRILQNTSSNEKFKSEIQWLFYNEPIEAAHTEKESGTTKLFLLELHSAFQAQTVIVLDCECEPLCMINNLLCCSR